MVEGTGTEHNVVIFGKGDLELVVPPSLPVEAGDRITFHATGQTVTLLFPPGTPLEYPNAETEWGIIQLTARRPTTLNVRPVDQLGRYPYAVWSHNQDPVFKTFAKGNSDPQIIIYARS